MIVVKIGGGNGNSFSNLVRDLPADKEIILVHGGSEEMNDVSAKLGHSPRMLTSPSGHSSRFTDERTLEIMEMVYSGSINKRLVTMLRKEGHNAIGLSGLDGGLIRGRRKSSVRYIENGKTRIMRGDNTGKVVSVNESLLRNLMKAGFIPVITIPIEDVTDNRPLNADCDRVAAAIAGSMNASHLVLLTNQLGLLERPGDAVSLIREIPAENIGDYIKYAKDRMKRKVLAALEAVSEGVGVVSISSSKIENPLTNALKGGGTTIC